MPLRVIFLGNSDSAFSNRHFKALLQAGCEVAGVVDAPPAMRRSTNPAGGNDFSFAALARQQGIRHFEPARPNQPEFMSQIADLRPDVLLAIGYTQILKARLLSLPRGLAANFHASLLPAYRGMHPVFWCLRNGERWSGLTVHVMDSGIDTGDILYQVRLRTRRDDTVASLYARIMDRSLPLVGRLLADLDKGRLRRSPQTESGASYYSAIQEEDFRLDWQWDAAKIARWITLSPGKCFTELSPSAGGGLQASQYPAPAGPADAASRGSHLFFLEARLSSAVARLPPGGIQSLDRHGCLVAAGKGSLRLKRVLLADGRQMGFAEACRLLGLAPGDRLGNAPQPVPATARALAGDQRSFFPR